MAQSFTCKELKVEEHEDIHVFRIPFKVKPPSNTSKDHYLAKLCKAPMKETPEFLKYENLPKKPPGRK